MVFSPRAMARISADHDITPTPRFAPA